MFQNFKIDLLFVFDIFKKNMQDVKLMTDIYCDLIHCTCCDTLSKCATVSSFLKIVFFRSSSDSSSRCIREAIPNSVLAANFSTNLNVMFTNSMSDFKEYNYIFLSLDIE